MSDFRPCFTCRCRSQAPLCHCTLRTITVRAEGTFESLRYSFGGDHPSQTTRHAVSSLQELDVRIRKGGISPSAPSQLAPELHSLPPILHILIQTSVQSCSKGAWGLSVPWQVISVFTDTTISPGSWPRQWSDRYTIRAGRNLPDKEFRYLRTVIVTAAVYWGFSSELRPRGLTPPFNLPAPGRCQAIYFNFRFSIALCFC
jgi:hypothetical protein